MATSPKPQAPILTIRAMESTLNTMHSITLWRIGVRT